jgi:hypothetical protein
MQLFRVTGNMLLPCDGGFKSCELLQKHINIFVLGKTS